MYILDTNHITVLGYSSPESFRLVQRLNDSGQDVVSTVITLEEQMRGWLAAINRTKDVFQQMMAYERLNTRTQFLSKWLLLPWSANAANIFVDLRKQGIRIGTADLKIASITLVNDATLLSRNLRDFSKVPNLKIENWLDG